MTEPRVEAGDRALETARKEQEQNVRIAKMQTEPEYRDPTAAELESPAFNAVWNAIKGWDMSRTSNGLYSGATGTDVCIILDALQSAMNAQERELLLLAGRLLESQSPEWGDVDGFSIEEWLIECGLLKSVDVTEPCDPEDCVCAEFGFPTKCNRRTELGERAERLLAERGEKI